MIKALLGISIFAYATCIGLAVAGERPISKGPEYYPQLDKASAKSQSADLFKAALQENYLDNSTGTYDRQNIKVEIEKIETVVGQDQYNFKFTIMVSYDNYSDGKFFVTTAGIEEYIVGFDYSQGFLKLTEYHYLDPFLPKTSKQKSSYKVEPLEGLIKLKLGDPMKGAKSSQEPESLLSQYSRVSAKNYALRYALTYNAEYRSFDGQGVGGDCTNFTSQALYNGGWDTIGSVDRTDINNWFYNTAYQSYTWINAHRFLMFNLNSGRSENVTNTCGLNVGDIISADWEKDQTIDHTMIVTEMDWSSCMPSLSYHSENRRNKPFNELPTTADYYGFHILYNENH